MNIAFYAIHSGWKGVKGYRAEVVHVKYSRTWLKWFTILQHFRQFYLSVLLTLDERIAKVQVVLSVKCNIYM